MTEPLTIIGSDISINGNLEGNEDLIIKGCVEGSINLSQTLTIEVGGVVHADVNVRSAMINGVLVGNIQASESVTLTNKGNLIGDIVAPRVVLVDGSSFKGTINMSVPDVDPNLETVAARQSFEEIEPFHHSLKVKSISEKSINMQPPAAQSHIRKPVSRQKPVPEYAKQSVDQKLPPQKLSIKKKPPVPEVRSVGKTRATKKKRHA